MNKKGVCLGTFFIVSVFLVGLLQSKVLSIKSYSIVGLSDDEEEEDEDDEDYDEEGVDAVNGSGRKKKRKKKKRRRMAGRKSKGQLSDKPQDFQVSENNRKTLLSVYQLFDWYLKGLGMIKVMLSLSEGAVRFGGFLRWMLWKQETALT